MAATHVASQSVPVRCIGAAGSRRKKPAQVFTTCPLRGSTRQQATKHRQVLSWLSSTTIRFTSGAKRRVPVAGFVKPVTVLDTMREQFTATVPQHPEPHHRINRTNQQSPGSPTSNHQKKHSHSASLRDATPHPPHQVTDTNPTLTPTRTPHTKPLTATERARGASNHRFDQPLPATEGARSTAPQNRARHPVSDARAPTPAPTGGDVAHEPTNTPTGDERDSGGGVGGW